jgi:hypothetical protein
MVTPTDFPIFILYSGLDKIESPIGTTRVCAVPDEMSNLFKHSLLLSVSNVININNEY